MEAGVDEEIAKVVGAKDCAVDRPFGPDYSTRVREAVPWIVAAYAYLSAACKLLWYWQPWLTLKYMRSLAVKVVSVTRGKVDIPPVA